jgi:hypothetical protein
MRAVSRSVRTSSNVGGWGLSGSTSGGKQRVGSSTEPSSEVMV